MRHAIKHLKADYKRAFLRPPHLAHVLWTSLTHPHFAVVARYRLARALWHKGSVANVLARYLLNKNAYHKGCDIARDASLGPGLVMPHAVGVVISPGTQLGANVTLHRDVLLGYRAGDPDGTPIIEDNVTIHAGACVLGRVRVGAGSVIGPNMRVVENVAPGMVVALPKPKLPPKPEEAEEPEDQAAAA